MSDMGLDSYAGMANGTNVGMANVDSSGAYGGALIGSLTGFGSYAWQKSASTKAAKKAFKRQLWMANTAYRRAVEDLKAAGLNPMLAYTQGGAATPSVSQAQIPDLDLGRSMETGVSTARNAMLLREELRQQRLNTETMDYLRDKAKEDARAAAWNATSAAYDAQEKSNWAPRWNMDRQEQQSRIDANVANRDLTNASAEWQRYDNTGKKIEAQWYGSEYGGAIRAAEKIVDVVPFLNLLKRGRARVVNPRQGSSGPRYDY